MFTLGKTGIICFMFKLVKTKTRDKDSLQTACPAHLVCMLIPAGCAAWLGRLTYFIREKTSTKPLCYTDSARFKQSESHNQ